MATYPIATGFPGVFRIRITIGVELEIILVGLPDDHSQGSRTRASFEFIRSALAPIEKKLNPPPFGQERLVFDIKSDVSIDTTGPGSRSGVEVATPILTGENWTWVIPEMCNAILEKVESVGATVECNDSTGLHVHIGLGRPYTIDELKRIAKAIIIFEKGMDTHHPMKRDGTNLVDGFTNYIASCRGSPAFRGMNTLGMIKKLESATTYLQLRGMINGLSRGVNIRENASDRYYKYNFEAVEIFGTIEFRQAAGTIDPVWIVKWIEYVIKFTSAAIATSDETYREWATLDEGPTDQEILTRFGLPPPEPDLSDTEDDESDEDYEPRKRKRDAFKRAGRRIRNALRAVRGSGAAA